MDSEPRLTRRQSHDESRHFLAGASSRPPISAAIALFAVLVLWAALYTGCDKNQLASLDSTNAAPLISQLVFSPDSVYLDALTPTNGEYTVTTSVRARATDSGGAGDIAAVTADVIMANGSLAASGIGLHDDGVAPDSAAGDGVFSGSLQFQLTRAQAGRWQIRVSAVDHRGALSNALSGQLKLARHNSPPQVFNLTAPDTLTIAPSDSSLLRMTIAASDSDGLADIIEVYWQSPDGQNPGFHFPLKDDGGLSSGPPSGDLIAGDGIFSFMQWIKDSPTVRGNYRLIFKAVDTVGDTSLTLLHNLIIR